MFLETRAVHRQVELLSVQGRSAKVVTSFSSLVAENSSTLGFCCKMRHAFLQKAGSEKASDLAG